MREWKSRTGARWLAPWKDSREKWQSRVGDVMGGQGPAGEDVTAPVLGV